MKPEYVSLRLLPLVPSLIGYQLVLVAEKAVVAKVEYRTVENPLKLPPA